MYDRAPSGRGWMRVCFFCFFVAAVSTATLSRPMVTNTRVYFSQHCFLFHCSWLFYMNVTILFSGWNQNVQVPEFSSWTATPSAAGFSARRDCAATCNQSAVSPVPPVHPPTHVYLSLLFVHALTRHSWDVFEPSAKKSVQIRDACRFLFYWNQLRFSSSSSSSCVNSMLFHSPIVQNLQGNGYQRLDEQGQDIKCDVGRILRSS